MSCNWRDNLCPYQVAITVTPRLISTAQIDTLDVGAAQVGAAQVAAVEPRIRQVGFAQIGAYSEAKDAYGIQLGAINVAGDRRRAGAPEPSPEREIGGRRPRRPADEGSGSDTTSTG